MHYICNDCNYEFDSYITAHPHTNLMVGIGCPICRSQMYMKKVCPKCKSTNLKETINEKKEQ